MYWDGEIDLAPDAMYEQIRNSAESERAGGKRENTMSSLRKAVHQVEFVSQRAYKHEDKGCGAASLMMLLKHHRLPIRTPSYRDLCECLWLTVDPEIKGWKREYGRGAYATDVERALG